MAGQFSSVKQAFDLPVGSEIVLRGWVRSRRDSKGVTFIELNDGSRFKSMQLVVEAGAISDETLNTSPPGAASRRSVDWSSPRRKGKRSSLK
jgi:asparaginyl-tRNA synthetase